MIIKRLITGFAVAIFIGTVIWAGEPWFMLAACLVSALAAFEFYNIVTSEHIQPLTYLGMAFSVLFVINARSPFAATCNLLFTLLTLVPLIWLIFARNKDHSFINWGWTVAGVLYTGWLISFYIYIRDMDNGMGWVFLVLSSTALSDVFAYVVGSNFGKHALASSISPGKTWEGAAGGLAAAIVTSVFLSLLFKLPVNYWQMVLAGTIIGAFSLVGDLVESLLKRNMKAKDAGRLLPGHGGVLDRIDSHLLIAPVAYYLIILVNNQGWLFK
ncbi:MAG: phosphatidate cytidylyltransferase [Dehalococcoidia bacterium]|jgi:phosphatidate cytidylyltransferase